MTLAQDIAARAAENGRTFDQQAAFERFVGDASTVRAQDAMRADMAAEEAVYIVTTTAGSRLGLPGYAIRDTRADAIDVANRLHAHRVANGAEGTDSVRVEHGGIVIWAIRDNGTIIA